MASPHKITTVKQLHTYLHAAMQLEHGTIPPYLTALYSIHPGKNSDAFHVIRTVAVEEMLHLTLAANIMNAVGSTPELTGQDFVPDYPTYLPDGETDFQVSRQAFSKECIETFLNIERPGTAPHEEARLVSRDRDRGKHLAGSHVESEMRFWSIGEFYEEIKRGLRYLHDQMGDALFSGDPARQAGPEYYYSGGGVLIAVTDLRTADAAIRLISEQGEGFKGGIYDFEHELAHNFRFEQLLLGQYYQKGDQQGNPTGPPLHVDWDDVYPIKKDATIDEFPEGSELRAAAIDFNRRYAEFLALLTKAYNGSPQLLIDAVVEMFRLRDGMQQLMRNPIPGLDDVNGAPTFEVSRLREKVAW
jgi:ferritin-like protein